MPNESVNLFLTVQSGNSEHTLTSLSDKTRALDKDTQLLKQATVALTEANKPLIEMQKKLQDQVKESADAIKKWENACKESGDELSKMNLDHAREQHADFKAELTAVNAQISTNQKTYKEYLEVVRKGGVENPGAGLGGPGKGSSSLSAIWSGLGIGKELASIAGQAGSVLASSLLGNDAGGIASGVLSSAITGVSLGTAINPGLGTAIGAAVGGLAGLASGAIEQWGNKDDAFKDYYGGLYEDVSARSREMVEAGSTIAGGREQTRMAFVRRLGSGEEADTYLAQVEKMAAQTNYDYDEIVGYAKLLLNSYAPDEVFDVLRDLSDATAGLNLSSADVNMMISGLSRMRTTGKATQEYLNYFRERGVDVDQALADALGVDKSAIAGMVGKGQIGGEDAAQAILEFIQREFGSLSDTLAGTYDAMVDNLGDMEASIKAAGGDAYNSLRKSGISAQQEAYEGELGEAMKEINAVLGENQARKENLQEQYMREVLDAVFNGNRGELWGTFDQEQRDTLTQMSGEYANLSSQYAELKARYDESGGTDTEVGAQLLDVGAQIESLYEATQIMGQAYFDNSDEMARLNEIEKDEIDAIRDVITPLETAHQRLYELNQTLSRGLAVRGVKDFYGSTIAEGTGGEVSEDGLGSSYLRGPAQSEEGYYTYSGVYVPYSHAYGLNLVPYDEYPALLHRDERVLTASEARAQDAGQGSVLNVTVTGNTITGAPEELADQLAEIIVRKIRQAAVAAAPK